MVAADPIASVVIGRRLSRFSEVMKSFIRFSEPTELQPIAARRPSQAAVAHSASDKWQKYSAKLPTAARTKVLKLVESYCPNLSASRQLPVAKRGDNGSWTV
jgi:hypothetical protein